MTKEEADAFLRAFFEKDARQNDEHANRLEKIKILMVNAAPYEMERLNEEIKHLRKTAELRREMAKRFQ